MWQISGITDFDGKRIEFVQETGVALQVGLIRQTKQVREIMPSLERFFAIFSGSSL
jgi:hypothetical protein